MMTMFHWDLPQQLQDLGGWANRVVIDYFVEYARLLFKEYGDMVKHWYTLNEPQLVGEFGYRGGQPGGVPFPLGVIAPGIGDYLAQHHQLIAHARVYHLYQEEFKHQQKGEIGIACQIFWAKPKTDKEEDIKAAKRSLLFEVDAMLHPLVKGDYPAQLREIIDRNSAQEGRPVSRLPVFSPQEVKLIKGSFDFIGINHYSSFLVSHGISESTKMPSQQYNTFIVKVTDPCAKVPGAFWLADYLKNVIGAINDGCNILGYTVWSFLDSFEWAGGYTLKFGLYHVDFESPEKKRTPKDSVKFFKKILKTRVVPL